MGVYRVQWESPEKLVGLVKLSETRQSSLRSFLLPSDIYRGLIRMSVVSSPKLGRSRTCSESSDGEGMGLATRNGVSYDVDGKFTFTKVMKPGEQTQSLTAVAPYTVGARHILTQVDLSNTRLGFLLIMCSICILHFWYNVSFIIGSLYYW